MKTAERLAPRMSTEEALQRMNSLMAPDTEQMLRAFTGHTIGVVLVGEDRYKGQILALNGGMMLFQREYQSTSDGSVSRATYLFPLASIHLVVLNPQWESEYTPGEE